MEDINFPNDYDIQLCKQRGFQFLFASDANNPPVLRFLTACSLFDMKPEMVNGYWDVPSEPGVYCYLDHYEITYVGKSRNLKSRIQGHPHERMMLGYACVPLELISLCEVQLISVLRPNINHESKGVSVLLADIQEVEIDE